MNNLGRTQDNTFWRSVLTEWSSLPRPTHDGNTTQPPHYEAVLGEPLWHNEQATILPRNASEMERHAYNRTAFAARGLTHVR